MRLPIKLTSVGHVTCVTNRKLVRGANQAENLGNQARIIVTCPPRHAR